MKQYSTRIPFTLLCCKKVIHLYKNSKRLYKIKSLGAGLLCHLIRHNFLHVFLMNRVHQLLKLLFLKKKTKTKKLAFKRKPPTLRGTLWDTEQAAETWASPLGPVPSNKPWLQTCNTGGSKKEKKKKRQVNLNVHKQIKDNAGRFMFVCVKQGAAAKRRRMSCDRNLHLASDSAL